MVSAWFMDLHYLIMCWLVSFRSCFFLVVNFSFMIRDIILNFKLHTWTLSICIANIGFSVRLCYIILYWMFPLTLDLGNPWFEYLLWISIFFEFWFYFTSILSFIRWLRRRDVALKEGVDVVVWVLIMTVLSHSVLLIDLHHSILSIWYSYILIIYMINLYYNTSYHCV